MNQIITVGTNYNLIFSGNTIVYFPEKLLETIMAPSMNAIEILGDNTNVIIHTNAVEGFSTDYTFVSKQAGLTDSSVTVANNLVSKCTLQNNVDTNSNNIVVGENILVKGQDPVDTADYNLNDEAGAQGLNITQITNTAALNPLLPLLLEEDFYRKKRSQLIETGSDYADAGAIEVNYLDDEQTYSDSTDEGVALLTPQARNLLARGSLGQAACRITGFAIGRGGYVYHNPVKVLPIDTQSDVARGYVVFESNNWTGTETIQIQARLPYIITFAPKVVGDEIDVINTQNPIYYFNIGTSIGATIDNVVDKINGVRNLFDTIFAQRENDTLHLIAVPCGSIGNSIWYAANGDFQTPHADPLAGGTLEGGVDESINSLLIDSVYEGVIDGEQCILEYINNNAIALTVKLHPDLGILSAIGEFIVKAEVVQSNFNSEAHGEIGTEFAFAVSHSPISCVHNKAIFVKRFIIQL